MCAAHFPDIHNFTASGFWWGFVWSWTAWFTLVLLSFTESASSQLLQLGDAENSGTLDRDRSDDVCTAVVCVSDVWRQVRFLCRRNRCVCAVHGRRRSVAMLRRLPSSQSIVIFVSTRDSFSNNLLRYLCSVMCSFGCYCSNFLSSSVVVIWRLNRWLIDTS